MIALPTSLTVSNARANSLVLLLSSGCFIGDKLLLWCRCENQKSVFFANSKPLKTRVFYMFLFLPTRILKTGLGLAVVRLVFAFQTKGFVLCFNILVCQSGL
ncbi:hypothetical protein NM06_09160 [Vibrio sinaloensis]|uniref:Uncharacterized protein n=1 Tax=Photobacterium sp. (strain ATCC 43367) TaxID=379097 RepID=A0A0A5HTY9_PHOS4|nr:hypothetical protein NM06_09160 [Vibrio sinaloensis]